MSGTRTSSRAFARMRRLGPLAVPLLVLACGLEEGAPDTLPASVEEIVQQLYDRAREAGEEVPPEAMEWARRDIERIGDWEYRIERLAGDDDSAIEGALGALGADRWEVFWIERRGGDLRIFLKRRAFSYLRMLPLSEMRRLVPE